MLISMNDSNVKTYGYVLRRTNYAEADRILNLITPIGKIAAMARGARKEKSKLAGGIEMFTLTEYNLHKGKGDLMVVTGARMVEHYNEIVKDFDIMQLAGMFLKRVSIASENSDSSDYYGILDQSLRALNDGIQKELVETWFFLNLLKSMGEEVNLYRDSLGRKLEIEKKYEWNKFENCFDESINGGYSENEIKLLRLMVSLEINVVKKIKTNEQMLEKALTLARIAAKV